MAKKVPSTNTTQHLHAQTAKQQPVRRKPGPIAKGPTRECLICLHPISKSNFSQHAKVCSNKKRAKDIMEEYYRGRAG